MRWLLIPLAVMAVAVPLKDCGTVKVNGPKTAQCPEGVYLVTADQSQSPPVLSYQCEKPAPSPSTPPSADPAPSPAASPSPSSTPQPSPGPSATPVPTPSPTAPAASPSACPKPDDVKLGFRAAVPKQPGFRNTFDITPTFEGKAIDVSCGQYLIDTYGEFQRFETSPVWGGGRESVELQSDNLYIMVEATNSDTVHWTQGCPDNCSGSFTQAGQRTYCVSYAHLGHWRCQSGAMNNDGRLVGYGTNSQGFDLAK
jgi:hypothetical protein